MNLNSVTFQPYNNAEDYEKDISRHQKMQTGILKALLQSFNAKISFSEKERNLNLLHVNRGSILQNSLFDMLHVNGRLPHSPDSPFQLVQVSKWSTPFLIDFSLQYIPKVVVKGIAIGRFGGHSGFQMNFLPPPNCFNFC